MSGTTLERSSCPQCHTSLTGVGRVTWCPRCEWNLGRYNPERHGRAFGWLWVDRWAHRTAYQLNARQFRAMSQGEPRLRAVLPTRLLLGATSVAMVTGVVAILATGVTLILRDFPSLMAVPGGLLVLVAIALRPRFGKPDPVLESVTRQQAPMLFSLIDRVAAAVGAPGPHAVNADHAFNASAGAVGLRRRRLLRMGLALWAVLPPQQRAALLAHELGHFANHDVRRGLLTQPALTTLGRLAHLTSPNSEDVDNAEGLVAWLGAAVGYGIMWTVSRFFLTGHLLLVLLALRDGQRAEYLADRWMVTVAGSAGAAGMLDTLVTADSHAATVARAARASGDIAAWQEAATDLRREVADGLPARRQLSVADETSLFATHPPTGLRRQLLETKRWRDPTVVLTERESALIDAELARLYARARKSVAAYEQN